MAKFVFKLQNILSIKEKLEDQAKAEYGMEIIKLREEEDCLKLLIHKMCIRDSSGAWSPFFLLGIDYISSLSLALPNRKLVNSSTSFFSCASISNLNSSNAFSLSFSKVFLSFIASSSFSLA